MYYFVLDLICHWYKVLAGILSPKANYDTKKLELQHLLPNKKHIQENKNFIGAQKYFAPYSKHNNNRKRRHLKTLQKTKSVFATSSFQEFLSLAPRYQLVDRPPPLVPILVFHHFLWNSHSLQELHLSCTY